MQQGRVAELREELGEGELGGREGGRKPRKRRQTQIVCGQRGRHRPPEQVPGSERGISWTELWVPTLWTMGLAGEEGWAACLCWMVWELPGSQHLHFPGTMCPSLFGQARLGIQEGWGGGAHGWL